MEKENIKNIPNLTIVIPCFNEEAVLPSTIDKLELTLNELINNGKISVKSSLLFVNGGSTDKTKEVLSSASLRNGNIKSVHFTRNFGNQSAILAGLKIATEKLNSDCVVTIDADLQQDEGKISKFVEKYSEGFDIVLGIRKKRFGDCFLKKIFASLFYKTMNFLDVHIVPNHSEYRLLSKRAIKTLMQYNENQIFLRGVISELGYKTAFVNYVTKPREKGESKFSYKTLFRLGFSGIVSHTNKPLRLILFTGLFITLICFTVLTGAVILEFMTPGGLKTVHFFDVWNSFLSGIQILCLGIIGQYLGQVLLEVKNRPKYLIEEENL